MIDVSSDLGRLLTDAGGGLNCFKAGSVDVILLWKSSKSKDAFFSSCQGFVFSDAVDVKLRRDMLFIDSCRS